MMGLAYYLWGSRTPKASKVRSGGARGVQKGKRKSRVTAEEEEAIKAKMKLPPNMDKKFKQEMQRARVAREENDLEGAEQAYREAIKILEKYAFFVALECIFECLFIVSVKSCKFLVYFFGSIRLSHIHVRVWRNSPSFFFFFFFLSPSMKLHRMEFYSMVASFFGFPGVVVLMPAIAFFFFLLMATAGTTNRTL